MRNVARLIILLGILLTASAVYDDEREIASVMPPAGTPTTIIVKRAENPKGFQNLMTYEWITCALAFTVGFILLGMCRRADQLDPMSSEFAGKKELDELEDVMNEEQRKR